MGDRGPVPKRSDRRRRRNKPEGRGVESAPGAEVVTMPAAKRSWHPAALQWYESLVLSGQHVYYQPSDWAVAYLVAESMSRDLRPQFVGFAEKVDDGVRSTVPVKESLPINGARLAAYLKAMSSLLVTEGDRRRVQLELKKPKPVGGEGGSVADVAWLDDARRGQQSS